jgi:hypothetical protein
MITNILIIKNLVTNISVNNIETYHKIPCANKKCNKKFKNYIEMEKHLFKNHNSIKNTKICNIQ